MSSAGVPGKPDGRDALWSGMLIPGLFMLAVAIISGHGVGSGLASHGDSRTVIEQSVPAILHGSYYPSRSYGNPGYEYAAAVLYAGGGLIWTSLYSLLLALASIFVFTRLLDPGLDRGSRFCALAALCFNPVFLINAFAVSEWMQMVFTLLMSLWLARSWMRTGRPLTPGGPGPVRRVAGTDAARCGPVLRLPDGRSAMADRVRAQALAGAAGDDGHRGRDYSGDHRPDQSRLCHSQHRGAVQ
jgi:hypothetical protein